MKRGNDFESMARAGGETSLAGELWELIRQRRKYWLLPILFVLLLFGALMFLSGTAAAPFIYTLF
jgi:hypothetical protein